jgi:hypothetical protein
VHAADDQHRVAGVASVQSLVEETSRVPQYVRNQIFEQREVYVRKMQPLMGNKTNFNKFQIALTAPASEVAVWFAVTAEGDMARCSSG